MTAGVTIKRDVCMGAGLFIRRSIERSLNQHAIPPFNVHDMWSFISYISQLSAGGGGLQFSNHCIVLVKFASMSSIVFDGSSMTISSR